MTMIDPLLSFLSKRALAFRASLCHSQCSSECSKEKAVMIKHPNRYVYIIFLAMHTLSSMPPRDAGLRLHTTDANSRFTFSLNAYVFIVSGLTG